VKSLIIQICKTNANNIKLSNQYLKTKKNPMKKQKNKKILILTIVLTIAASLLFTGCAKTETPIIDTSIKTIETDTKANTISETESTPETSQETSFSPEIIFSSSDGSSVSKIYICNSDGSDLQALMESGINTSPCWNKEHSKIVFTSLDPANGISNLYIYDMKNKSKTLLLKRFSPRDPSFSPDGNTVVFADFTEEGTENSEIYTIGIDGSNLTKLTDNPARDYFPKYSPDGKSIVFSSERDGNIQLYTMNSNGENVKRLMKNGFTDNCGSFSPDGLNIIFNSDRGGNSDIYTISSGGTGEMKNITNNSAGNYEACYSPDGSMIVYRSNKGLADNMSYDIFVMSADGSNQTNIAPGLKDTDEFNPSW
jgi:tol-pal system beta propeller repeat protein TolB